MWLWKMNINKQINTLWGQANSTSQGQVLPQSNTFFLSQTINSEKLTTFINTINGKDGNLCHLVTVPPGPLLSDALISSPILQGEDGAGPGMEYASEYGFDPNSDPELALVSGSKSDQ